MEELNKVLLEKVIRPFWNFRGNEKKPGTPITFNNFLKTRPDGGDFVLNKADKPADLMELMALGGVDPFKTDILGLISREDDFRWLVGPFIEDAVYQGYVESDTGKPALWTVLCFQVGMPAQQESIKKVKLGFVGAPARTGELENLPTTTMYHSDESLSWGKVAWMLKMSNELLRFNPLPVIQPWLTEAGRIQQYTKNRACVKAIVNGTVSTGTDSCPIIGVADTEKGLQYSDFLEPWGLGDEIGEQWFTLLYRRSMSVRVGSIEEFKKREYGTPKVVLKNSPEPEDMNRYISPEVPNSEVVLVDTRHCVRERVSIPFHIMDGDDIDHYAQKIAFVESSTFERVGEKACIGIDETLDIDDNPIPSWMEIGQHRTAA